MRRSRPWLVFALIFAWKVALFVSSSQPIPANDAFFYDGAAIHKMLYGGFYNPAISMAFPISGHKLFSGYPPLYQFPLLAWLTVFGISARSVMALHLVLFGGYLLAVLGILKRLAIPTWCASLAGGFTLLITWHDRPDSLAQLLGILAVYAWVRSRAIFQLVAATAPPARAWSWWMSVFVVLCLCTSLQIGGVYLLIMAVGTVVACHFGGEHIPIGPLALLFIAPVAGVLIVRLGFPLAWAGFLEHARQTPTFTGLRFPSVAELLKIVRATPGIILALFLLLVSWLKQHRDFDSPEGRRHEVFLLPLVIGALAVVVAAMFVLTANFVGVAVYLQPLLVAAYLAICASIFPGEKWLRLQVTCVIGALLLGSLRAIGMTTWGLACAHDVGYVESRKLIESELASDPPGAAIVMSSAFLYDAVQHKELRFFHSDWLAKAEREDSRISDLKGLSELKPRELILTQFDYFRRWKEVLEDARTVPGLGDVQVIQTTRKVPSPDSIRAVQQVVQHISWAPVIVRLTWQN